MYNRTRIGYESTGVALVSEMDATSNSTDCYSIINTTSRFIIDVSVSGATAFIGAVSALTAIGFILVAKAYKDFIYRLLLYMATVALFSCLAKFATSFVTDYKLRYEVVLLIRAMENYFVCVYFFLLCWLGLYLFSLAVFRVQLKKTKHEVIGLVTVLVTPLTFLWVIAWKQRSTVSCDDKNNLMFKFYFFIPVTLSILFSFIFVGAVLITLCKNAMNRVENTLQQQHRRAARETIPLLVFMTTHQICLVSEMVIIACQLYLAGDSSFILWEIYGLWPLGVISLPILMMCHPRIRRKVKCKRMQKYKNMHITSGYGTTVQQSHLSSYTRHSSPRESSGTDHTHYNTPCAEGPSLTRAEREPLL